MNTTRRDLLTGAGALALVALATTDWRRGLLGFVRPARAADPSPEELMQPGPLGEMVLGSAEAPVTIIEYASMTCSHCAAFAVQTYPQLKARYIDTGKVRYILREFPLDPLAAAGFMLARCAPEGKYFDMVDMLFHQQVQWAFVNDPLPPLLNLAKQAGFSKETFDACLSNQKVLDGIDSVRTRGAEKFGVSSTPTFFINGKVHRGDMPIDELAKLIDPYLKS